MDVSSRWHFQWDTFLFFVYGLTFKVYCYKIYLGDDMEENYILVDMLIDRVPLEEFKKLFINNRDKHDWEKLLNIDAIKAKLENN